MIDDPSQETKKAAETDVVDQFNFRAELGNFLRDGEVFDDYYRVEAGHGVPEESIEAQVCRKVVYETTVTNKVGEDAAEMLFIPIEIKRSVVICAPPVVPYVVDEFMPQELWDVVRSDDPSRVPTLDELRCVEIGIYSSNKFKDGKVRKSGDIYRVDLTKDEPVVYRRYPIPENKQAKKDAMGTDEGAQILSAMLDFLQPLPRFKYEQVDPDELKRIVEIAKEVKAGHPAGGQARNL